MTSKFAISKPKVHLENREKIIKKETITHTYKDASHEETHSYSRESAFLVNIPSPSELKKEQLTDLLDTPKSSLTEKDVAVECKEDFLPKAKAEEAPIKFYEEKFIFYFKEKNNEPTPELKMFADRYCRGIVKRRPKVKSITTVLTEEEKLLQYTRTIREILNKINESNFDGVFNELKELKTTTVKQLDIMTNMIFDKAISDIGYSKIYAQLCKKLEILYVLVSNPNGKFSEKKSESYADKLVDKETIEPVKFLVTLLTKCQKAFTYEIETPIFPEKEEEDKARKKGVMIFLGELYNAQMLAGKIIDGCIDMMIAKPEEHIIDSLMLLMTTICPNYKKRKDAKFKDILKNIKNLTLLKSLGFRLKVQLEKLLEKYTS